MIYFDVTKSARSRHASGLMRVNRRLRDELGEAAQPVVWGEWDPRVARKGDWYLTTEVFDVAQREGFAEFLAHPTCRTAALFADAIPLQLPQVTWPHSVARHPGYMKALARFDHVLAISEAVRRDLLGFWRWQGTVPRGQVTHLPLAADFDGAARHPRREAVPPPVLLCIGIVEPRKNQTFLVDVAEALWRDGLDFELHVVGRINPHFGRPIVQKMKASRKRFPRLAFHEAASDETLASIFGRTRAVVFPTIAEGCGLPILESLWRGLPCVCTDLPVLREIANEGGCVMLPKNETTAWQNGLREVLTNDERWRELSDQAAARALPTWAECAGRIRAVLGEA